MNKGKKISGGRYIQPRKKKSREISGQRKIVKLGAEKRKIKNVRGGCKKVFLLGIGSVNLQEKGRGEKLEIKRVIETPSNKFLARQNIITKGTIVETSKGRVRITNRPTQEGVLNGIKIN